jgi:O-antigen biosynthesis protein
VRVCLLSPGLPGTDPGDAVGRLAGALADRDGVEVTLALTEHRPGGAREAALGAARAVTVEEAIGAGSYDAAIATHWTTTARLFEQRATRHAYWVDGLAHHRMGAWNAERIAAQLSYDLPVDFLAASEAIGAELADLRPEARCLVVRNGVDKAAFTTSGDAVHAGPLRVVAVELGEEDPGRRWAADALAQTGAATEVRPLPREAGAAARAEAYRGADVVLMLSTVDGILGAPLEGMHCGATCIVMPVSDVDELVRHGENGIVAEPDDVRGVARWLDHLARDREWLRRLREEAAATASAWPSWEQAAAGLSGALERLVAEPPPDVARWPVRLMADAIAGVALFRNDYFVVTGELERLRSDGAYRAAVALRERLESPRLAGLRRVAAPAARAARRRLG